MSAPIHIVHPFPPYCDAHARILILGTMPSVKSREGQFYYHHPQNRFWRVLAAVFGEEAPQTIAEKKLYLTAHGIALWDVIHACEIAGSSDSSIRQVIPNDLSQVLDAAPITRIFTNGAKAGELYRRFCAETVSQPMICLPSTSPANAAWSLPRLIQAWSVIADM